MLSHVHDRQKRTMEQGWELRISNLESASDEEVWFGAPELRCTAAAGRPGTKASLELVVRRGAPSALASGAGSSRGELGQAGRQCR